MDITQDHPDWRYASGQGLGKRALSKHGTLLAPPYLYQSRSSLNLSTSTSMYSSIQKLSEPHTLKGFLEASSHRYDRSLTPFLPFSLLKKMGGQGWKFQASIHGLVFMVTSPHPEAYPEPPYWNKDAPITQENTRLSGTLCRDPGSKTNR